MTSYVFGDELTCVTSTKISKRKKRNYIAIINLRNYLQRTLENEKTMHGKLREKTKLVTVSSV